jgi:ATP-binding protein involved in chromosome partitioning
MSHDLAPVFENVDLGLVEELTTTLKQTMLPELDCSAWDLGILHKVTQGERLAIDLVLPSFGLKSEKMLAFAIKKAVVKHALDPEKVDLNFYSDVKPSAVQSVKIPDVADIRNIILVSSGKGGVGKSTVASNLAVSMAALGCRVGLLDADVYGPSVPVMFGLEGEGQVKGVKDDESNTTYMIPPQKYDVALMSIGFLVDTDAPMIWRGPMIASASMQMFHNVYWGQIDYLIVDLPPGTGDIQLTIAQKINVAGAIVVSTPQDVALKDVVRAKNMFDKVNIPVLGLIENMSHFLCHTCDTRHEIFASGGAKKKAEALGMSVLGEIPLVAAVRQASDEGCPIAAGKDLPEVKDIFTEISHEVIARVTKNALTGQMTNNSALNNPKPAPAPEEKKRRLPTL